jgi:hypothetical protein
MFARNLLPALFVFLTMFLTACISSPVKEFDDINFSEILALGKVIEANKTRAEHEIDLIVRLYEVPIFENDCFVETHGICQNQYYVAVSTYDEYPKTNIFKITQKGVLSNFEWVKDEKVDFVKLALKMDKYSKEAINNNPSLLNVSSVILIELTPKSIHESTEKR